MLKKYTVYLVAIKQISAIFYFLVGKYMQEEEINKYLKKIKLEIGF